MDSTNNRSMETRFRSIQYKMFLTDGVFKNHVNLSSDHSKDHFWRYLLSYVLPKYANFKTPSQILFKNTSVTIVDYLDPEILNTYKSIAMVKRKRIIRIIEEANEQDSSLSYKDIAYLTFSTINTVSKWVNDTKLCDYAISVSQASSLLTRKTMVVNLFIEEILLKMYDDISRMKTLRINHENTYSVLSERFWFFCEFLLSCLLEVSSNSAVDMLLRKMCISSIQLQQFIDLYHCHKEILQKKYNTYFDIASCISDPIELMSLTINTVVSSLGSSEDLYKKITDCISLYQQYKLTTQEGCILFYLRDKAVSKHKQHSLEKLKPIRLKIFDPSFVSTYNGIKNKDFIQQTVLSLQNQAEEGKVHISENDISFLLGISRDYVQNCSLKI